MRGAVRGVTPLRSVRMRQRRYNFSAHPRDIKNAFKDKQSNSKIVYSNFVFPFTYQTPE
jgi:hypothetical protein